MAVAVRAVVSAHFDTTSDPIQGAESGPLSLPEDIEFYRKGAETQSPSGAEPQPNGPRPFWAQRFRTSRPALEYSHA